MPSTPKLIAAYVCHVDTSPNSPRSDSWVTDSFTRLAVSPKLVPAEAPRHAVRNGPRPSLPSRQSNPTVPAVPPPASTYVTWLTPVGLPGVGASAVSTTMTPPVIVIVLAHSSDPRREENVHDAYSSEIGSSNAMMGSTAESSPRFNAVACRPNAATIARMPMIHTRLRTRRFRTPRPNSV